MDLEKAKQTVELYNELTSIQNDLNIATSQAYDIVAAQISDGGEDGRVPKYGNSRLVEFKSNRIKTAVIAVLTKQKDEILERIKAL